MTRFPLIIAAGALVLTAALALAQAKTQWVERTKADVRAGRSSVHDVVDTVTKGEKVQVQSAQDGWVFVETPRAKKGWVFEKALASTTVTPGSSDFLKLAPGDASTSRTAATAGAKGVYAEGYARQKGYDYSIVRWVEENQPTNAADLEAFLRDGGLPTPGAAR
jgi:uncharacterized protein YgiM (DUF1202 family)